MGRSVIGYNSSKYMIYIDYLYIHNYIYIYIYRYVCHIIDSIYNICFNIIYIYCVFFLNKQINIYIYISSLRLITSCIMYIPNWRVFMIWSESSEPRRPLTCRATTSSTSSAKPFNQTLGATARRRYGVVLKGWMVQKSPVGSLW